MTYKFLAARYTFNPAVIEADTEKAGTVALSEVDTPEAWAELHASGIEIAPYTPPPPPPYRLKIAVIYARATDAEAGQIDAAIETRGPRIRGLWRSSLDVASDGDLFAEMRAAATALFGAARADEILAPETEK